MEEHKMYPPGLIFGVLLTGENYDDEQHGNNRWQEWIWSKTCSISFQLNSL